MQNAFSLNFVEVVVVSWLKIFSLGNKVGNPERAR